MNTEVAYIVENLIKGFPICLAIASTTINTYAIRKAKLQRKSFSGEISYNADSVLARTRSFSEDKLDYTKREILKPYVEKLVKNLSLEELKIIRRNLNTVKVEKSYKPLFLGLLGYYDIKKNEISYLVPESLGHEFLHMSSTIYDRINDIYFSGFSQEDGKNIIGLSLNEGYTELLTSRFYNIKQKESVYVNEVRMAKMLELFFDNKEEMTRLYFTCDLLGFIKQLEKYAPYEDVIKLIIDMDDYSVYNHYSNFLSIKKSASIYERIYNWFVTNSNDQEKINELEKLINEDIIVSNIFKRQNIQLSNKNR